MRLFLKSAYIACVLCWGVLSSLNASPGHEGHEEAQASSSQANASLSSERPSFIGSSFEGVLDVCDQKKAHLYLADCETNQPIDKANITIQGAGSQTFKTDAHPSQQTGEYTFSHQMKEGEKVELKIDIKEETRAETITFLISQWPKPTGQCQEKAHA